jgi:hypothetical protein
MQWNFENRIILPQKPLSSSDTSRTLHESGNEIVTLRPEFSTDGFNGADWLMLRGQGYASSDLAFQAGKLWRQHLAVAFAHAGFAATFDSVSIEHREGDRERSPEAPGLRVYPVPEPPAGGLHAMMVAVGMRAEGRVTRPLDLFLSDDLPSAHELIPSGLNRRLELAYTTVHTALATENPEVKYILLVTAVEALIDDDQLKPEAIVTALAVLQEYIEQSGQFDQVRDELKRLLKEDEKESVGQVGAQLASQLDGTYGQKQPDSFFKHVYNRRSRLLHGALNYTGSRKRPSLQEIAEDLPELRRFVLDLLTAESANQAN